MTASLTPALSIIITADPTPGVLEYFLKELEELNENFPEQIELIIVDSLGVMKGRRVPLLNPESTALQLRTLFPGEERRDQLQAILWALNQSKGNAVIAIDPDMHGNLKDIPRFLEAYRLGKHIVYGRRRKRVGLPAWRGILSSIYNDIARISIGLPLKDFNSPMVLLSQDAIKAMNSRPNPKISARLYAIERMKEHLHEIDIITTELPEKRSTYSFYRLLIVGLRRHNELFSYLLFRIFRCSNENQKNHDF